MFRGKPENFIRTLFVIFVRMNKKLTISIDNLTIERAKEYARSKGQSLSEIIENYLKLISSKADAPDTNLEISKFRGSVKLPDNVDYKELLSEALIEKYRK